MTDASSTVGATTAHGLPIELTTTPTTSYPRRLGSLALTVAAVAGALSLAVALLFAVTGVTPLVFQSGSMSPTIPTGSLALARTVDTADLAVGDVVSVRDVAGTRVTHRVAAIAGDGTLTLKGDANLSADAETYPVDSVDRVFVSVPHVGSALSVLTGPTGRGLATGLGVAVVLVLVSLRAGARPGRTERVAVLGALALVLGVGVGLARAPEGTAAFWTDNVAGTSRITVAAPAQPEKPVLTSCTRTGNSITLTWTSVASPQNYQIRHTNPTTEPTVSGTLRLATTQNANFNNSVGEVWVVAMSNGLESESAHYRFSGNGSGATCVPR
jgi:signal peptidase I